MFDQLHPTVQFVLERITGQAAEEGFTVDWEPVQHGVKIVLEAADGSSAAGTLYFSAKKKRLSWVPNGKGDGRIARFLSERMEGHIGRAQGRAAEKDTGIGDDEKGLQRWIGTDEAGKGDLFGPLVAAGFACTPEIAEALRGLGVRDSKELSPARIHSLAKTIFARWPDRCSVVEIGPKRYNEIYDDFTGKGGINGVLGWAHARAIRDLYARHPDIEAAVVDKFGGEGRLKANLPKKEAPARLIVRPRGESNVAVAAAAILARTRFDEALDKLEAVAGFRPHAGSGSPAARDLKRLAKEKPKELEACVKAHFGPVKQLGLI